MTETVLQDKKGTGYKASLTLALTTDEKIVIEAHGDIEQLVDMLNYQAIAAKLAEKKKSST